MKIAGPDAVLWVILVLLAGTACAPPAADVTECADPPLVTVTGEESSPGNAVVLWGPSGRVDALIPDPATAEPAMSPDGRTVAFISGKGDPSDSTGFDESRVGVVSVETREVTLLSASVQGSLVGDLQWSTDGSEVAFIRYGNDAREIMAVRLEDGEERRLLNVTEFESGSFNWSPDGRELLVPTSPDPDLPPLTGPPWRYPDELRRYSVETGEYLTVENDHTFIVDVAWSPDGRLVAMETDSPGTGRIRLWVLDLETGDSQPVDRRRGGPRSISWSGPYMIYTYNEYFGGTDSQLMLMRWDSRSQERARISRPGLDRFAHHLATISAPRCAGWPQ